jgi:hypothetical protein
MSRDRGEKTTTTPQNERCRLGGGTSRFAAIMLAPARDCQSRAGEFAAFFDFVVNGDRVTRKTT